MIRARAFSSSVLVRYLFLVSSRVYEAMKLSISLLHNVVIDMGLISSMSPCVVVLGIGQIVSTFHTLGQHSLTKHTLNISYKGTDSSAASGFTRCFGMSPETQLFGILKPLNLTSTCSFVTSLVKFGPLAIKVGMPPEQH